MSEDDVPEDYFYTEEELEMIRAQLREGLRLASEAAKGMYEVHPRILAARAKLAATKAEQEKNDS
jgi:hypothetical protein